MDNADKKVSASLMDTIKSSDMPSLAVDTAEIAFDSILEEGVLRDIPVVSAIVGIGKVRASIRDYLLAKKVLLFLQPLGEVPDEDRLAFAQKLEENPETKTHVGETVIMLLDRFDDFHKARWAGQLFSFVVAGRIQYKEFVRLNNSIDRAFISDLDQMLDCFRKSKPQKYHRGKEQPLWQALYLAGLANFESKSGFARGLAGGVGPSPRPMTEDAEIDTETRYFPNSVARRLSELLLGDDFDEFSFRKRS